MIKLFGQHEDSSKQSCIFEFLVLQDDGSAVSQVTTAVRDLCIWQSLLWWCLYCRVSASLCSKSAVPYGRKSVQTTCVCGLKVVKSGAAAVLVCRLWLRMPRMMLVWLSGLAVCVTLDSASMCWGLGQKR